MTTSTLNLTQFTCYRQQSEAKATKLFARILAKEDKFLVEAENLTILVVGAGTFPGYLPLVKRLAEIAPNLQTVNITLVEPEKKLTDLFMQHFANLPPDVEHIQMNLVIENQGIEEFLKEANGALFDVIYFEHPETMTLPIVLAKLGFRNFQRVLSLRKSTPVLAKILHPNAIILASCMSKHELKQLRALLKFSLNTKSKLFVSRNPMHYFFGGPFCVGLRASVNKIMLADGLQKERVAVIHRSDNFLFGFVLLSMVLYLVRIAEPYHFAERTLAVLVIGAQLFLHRPGKIGLLIKLFLMLALCVLIF